MQIGHLDRHPRKGGFGEWQNWQKTHWKQANKPKPRRKSIQRRTVTLRKKKIFALSVWRATPDRARCGFNVGSARHGLMKPALMVVPFTFATIVSQMGNCEYLMLWNNQFVFFWWCYEIVRAYISLWDWQRCYIVVYLFFFYFNKLTQWTLVSNKLKKDLKNDAEVWVLLHLNDCCNCPSVLLQGQLQHFSGSI